MIPLKNVHEKQFRRAVHRAQCVVRFRIARRAWRSGPDPIGERVLGLIARLGEEYPDLGAFSRTSLYRWERRFRSHADLPKLIDRRGGDRKSTGDPAAWGYFEELWLESARPVLTDCWRRTRDKADECGWTWCSESACRRQLDKRLGTRKPPAPPDEAGQRRAIRAAADALDGESLECLSRFAEAAVNELSARRRAQRPALKVSKGR